MFDEYFNPPPSVVSLVLAPADPTGTPLSTSVEQDAPTASTSSIIQETQSLVLFEGVEEELQQAPFDDDPLARGVEGPSVGTCRETNSQENHHQLCNQTTHLLNTSANGRRYHPLENVIGNPSRHVSTRKQLQTDSMWCFFDAFLTSVELKNFKEALLESSWIDAMQEEIHEFE
ncbi:hypothetical protein Tco_0514745 [Tanacetum coccineum]